MLRVFYKLIAFLVICHPFATNAQWSLTGNAGTTVATNFLGTTDNRGLVFRTNNIERMRFTSAGNLGLGVTNPIARFQVFGSSTTSLTGTGYLISGDPAGSNLSMDNNEIQARFDSGGSTLYLNYWGGNIYAGRTGLSPALFVNGTSGHVGIANVDDPNYFLDINADNVYGGIVVQNHTALLPSVYLQKTGLGAAMFAEKTDPSSFSYTIQANTVSDGYAIAAFAATGQASGIYTSSDNEYGIFADGGGGAGDYAGYFNGNVFTTGLYQSSDIKLKKNIRDLPNALQIVQQLKPKLYEYRQDGNYALMDLPKGERIGFLAQDVEKLMPGLINDSYFETKNTPAIAKQATAFEAAGKPIPSETIEFKALNYTEMIPLLVKAIQEQQQMITVLQQKIASLEAGSSIQSNQDEKNSIGSIQVAPNPFSKETIISLNVPTGSNPASLIVFNNEGKIMQQTVLSPGKQTIRVNGSAWAPGIYSCRAVADGKIIAESVMIVAR